MVNENLYFSFAQSNFISEYFADYEKDPTFTTVNVSSKTFSLFTEIETNDVDELKVLGAIAKLDGVKVVSKEKAGKMKRDSILLD